MGAKEVLINGRKGYEAIIQPVVKMKIIVSKVNDKYWVIWGSTSDELWDIKVYTLDLSLYSFVIE